MRDEVDGADVVRLHEVADTLHRHAPLHAGARELQRTAGHDEAIGLLHAELLLQGVQSSRDAALGTADDERIHGGGVCQNPARRATGLTPEPGARPGGARYPVRAVTCYSDGHAGGRLSWADLVPGRPPDRAHRRRTTGAPVPGAAPLLPAVPHARRDRLHRRLPQRADHGMALRQFLDDDFALFLGYRPGGRRALHIAAPGRLPWRQHDLRLA